MPSRVALLIFCKFLKRHSPLHAKQRNVCNQLEFLSWAACHSPWWPYSLYKENELDLMHPLLPNGRRQLSCLRNILLEAMFRIISSRSFAADTLFPEWIILKCINSSARDDINKEVLELVTRVEGDEASVIEQKIRDGATSIIIKMQGYDFHANDKWVVVARILQTLCNNFEWDLDISSFGNFSSCCTEPGNHCRPCIAEVAIELTTNASIFLLLRNRRIRSKTCRNLAYAFAVLRILSETNKYGLHRLTDNPDFHVIFAKLVEAGKVSYESSEMGTAIKWVQSSADILRKSHCN